MKVAIDGTHSTGKTTVWKILEADKYKDYKYIPELGSVIATNNFLVDSPLSWQELFNNKEKYTSFIDLLVDNQKNQENCKNVFIDSSLYRAFAYAIENGLSISDSLISEIKYDVIFYCPIEFDFIDDDFRFNFFRKEVDKRLFDLIKKYHHGKLVLLNGTIENRINLIKQTI